MVFSTLKANFSVVGLAAASLFFLQVNAGSIGWHLGGFTEALNKDLDDAVKSYQEANELFKEWSGYLENGRPETFDFTWRFLGMNNGRQFFCPTDMWALETFIIDEGDNFDLVAKACESSLYSKELGLQTRLSFEPDKKLPFDVTATVKGVVELCLKPAIRTKCLAEPDLSKFMTWLEPTFLNPTHGDFPSKWERVMPNNDKQAACTGVLATYQDRTLPNEWGMVANTFYNFEFVTGYETADVKADTSEMTMWCKRFEKCEGDSNLTPVCGAYGVNACKCVGKRELEELKHDFQVAHIPDGPSRRLMALENHA